MAIPEERLFPRSYLTEKDKPWPVRDKTANERPDSLLGQAVEPDDQGSGDSKWLMRALALQQASGLMSIGK